MRIPARSCASLGGASTGLWSTRSCSARRPSTWRVYPRTKGHRAVFNLKSEGGRVVAPNAVVATDWRPTSRTTRRKTTRAPCVFNLKSEGGRGRAERVRAGVGHRRDACSTARGLLTCTRPLVDLCATSRSYGRSCPAAGAAYLESEWSLAQVRDGARAGHLRVRQDAEHGRERRRGRRVPGVAFRRRRRV